MPLTDHPVDDDASNRDVTERLRSTGHDRISRTPRPCNSGQFLFGEHRTLFVSATCSSMIVHRRNQSSLNAGQKIESGPPTCPTLVVLEQCTYSREESIAARGPLSSSLSLSSPERVGRSKVMAELQIRGSDPVTDSSMKQIRIVVKANAPPICLACQC
jgi:hypothetical protein